MARYNPYLARVEAVRLAAMRAAAETTERRILEYVTLALNSPKLMKKNVFRRVRLKRLEKMLQEIDAEFGDAFYDDPESDYKQNKFDEALRRIDPTTPPFCERYPYLRDPMYNKPYKQRKR